MTAPPPARRRPPAALRSLEAAALAGFIHAVLLIAAIILLLRAPSPGTGDTAVPGDWYLDDSNQQSTLLAVNLLSISMISFVWFVAVIRRRVGERENRFFGTVFLGSAVLLAGIWLIAGVMFAAPAVSAYRFGVAPEAADIALWQTAGLTLISVVATRLEAVFVLSTTAVGRLSGAFPRFLIVAGYLVGLVLLLVPLPSEALIVLFPAWVAVVSAVLLYRRRELDSVSAGATTSG